MRMGDFGAASLGVVCAATEESIGDFSGCVTTFHDDSDRLALSQQVGTTMSERLRFQLFLAIKPVSRAGSSKSGRQCRKREKYGPQARAKEQSP